MDIYCINIFCDDRDNDLKPWDQDENDHRITMEDKIILKTMWHMHNQVQEPSKSIGKKGKNVTKNNEADIKNKLISMGYGVPRKRRK